MRIVLTSLVAGCLALGCSDKPAPQPTTPAPATPTPTPTATEPAPPDPSKEPMTPEQCTSQGGEPRGDIGNGKVACKEGETELGRVRMGIEGGVCCKQ